MASSKEKKAYDAKNRDRLKALGLTDAEIEGYKNIWGSHINDDEYERVQKKWTSDKLAGMNLPQSVMNELKDLPPDMQIAAATTYTVNKEADAQSAAWMQEALALATKDADPLYKQAIWATEDALMNNFEELKGDYDAQVNRYEDRIRQLNEDLESGKEFLTMEQQSSLAQQLMTYEVKSEQIQETMASKGLAFSTNRKVANRRLDEYTENVSESTKRQYANRIDTLQKEADRGNQSAIDEIAELERKLGEDMYSLGSQAEQRLGSDILGKAEGIGDYYKPKGDIIGSLEGEYQSDLDTRTNTYYDELSQKSFNPGSIY